MSVLSKTDLMENQMEKKLENELETVIIMGYIGVDYWGYSYITGTPQTCKTLPRNCQI